MDKDKIKIKHLSLCSTSGPDSYVIIYKVKKSTAHFRFISVHTQIFVILQFFITFLIFYICTLKGV